VGYVDDGLSTHELAVRLPDGTCSLLAAPMAAGPQVTCFTSTKVQILTHRSGGSCEVSRAVCGAGEPGADMRQGALLAPGTHFTCFTGTKVQILTMRQGALLAPGTHFTCFTGTKVQILTMRQGALLAPGTHFTCFTGTKVQILTMRQGALLAPGTHSLYLLYWCKRAHTDADGAADRVLPAAQDAFQSGCARLFARDAHAQTRDKGSQITCFTGTKVQILKRIYIYIYIYIYRPQSTRPPRDTLRYSVYLLYWYKSTNTDTGNCQDPRNEDVKGPVGTVKRVLSLRALLAQKYKY
jgi:hypothetical protein